MIDGIEPPLTREEKLRRVVLLCASFIRNLAYQRAMVPYRERLTAANGEFWITVTGNCTDVAVLEWCKLFALARDGHHWSRVVTSPSEFEKGLLSSLKLTAAEFADYQAPIRDYRDKFIAHLDGRRVMDVPLLETAYEAVIFYHGHVVENEAEPSMLRGLPSSRASMLTYYREQERSAHIQYERAL